MLNSARPNIIFVFADQWRRQATGFAGNEQVRTPHLDRLAGQSIELTHAVAGMPVCCPYRASLLSGQTPVNHGVVVNDVPLPPETASIGKALKAGGYDTAWIGKWHVDGHGRKTYIPPERRQGFDYWKVLECTHDYNNSFYYAHDETTPRTWEGYDAFAQTDDAIGYVRDHAHRDKPFALFLSWGPPHDPYDTAPEAFRKLYDPAQIELRPNVPTDFAAQAQRNIAGYYAHCTALDDAMGRLLAAIDEADIRDNTLLIFTSDHGDMLGSHSQWNKQQAYDESLRVPFLLRWPGKFGNEAQRNAALIDAPDLMPTLLGLCGLPCPESVDGRDFSACFAGGEDPSGGAALLSHPVPFGQWYAQGDARAYRGLRTRRWTYARTVEGPWLLFDNDADPYQMCNLVNESTSRATVGELNHLMDRKLAEVGDAFEPPEVYMERFGWVLNEKGTTLPVHLK